MRWLVGLVAVMALAGCASVAERPAAGAGLAPCPSSPNCVCSTDSGRSGIAPFAIEGDADAAWTALRDVLEATPRTRIVSADGDYLHATSTTAIMRFTDDLEFLLDRERGVIDVRSASRVGYSDLGANRKRVEALRGALIERGAVAAGTSR